MINAFLTYCLIILYDIFDKKSTRKSRKIKKGRQENEKEFNKMVVNSVDSNGYCVGGVGNKRV